MKNVIYQIRNLVNGKRYIGSAMTFRTRKTHHVWSLAKDRHDNPHLQNSYNKYGIESFVYEIIDTVRHAEELEFREDYWIDKYDFDKELYNIRLFCHSNVGMKHSEETKQKISEATKGENNPMYGRKHSKRTIQKMRENRTDKRSVMQIDKNTDEVIAIFSSTREATRVTGIENRSIQSVCKNEIRTKNGHSYRCLTAGGFVWKFADEIEEKTNKPL